MQAITYTTFLLLSLSLTSPVLGEYLIGAGIADITGPAADINLMGYAKPNQDSGGIHLRLFSRSIIIEDQSGQRILYSSLDNGMISQLLRVQVLKRLGEKFGTAMFNETNVMMTATHTHSAPGGFFQYMLYNTPSAGFIAQTLQALVDGIIRSVERANENLQPGKIYFTQGKLYDASINRSPTSYANNPAEEKALYKEDTDKTMYLLRIVDKNDEPIAMINWFAVHGTSMNNTNHLISSDNKGYASLLFEQEFNQPNTLPGKGKFVAIFAQANEGDVSPNTRGPRCIDTGLPCDTHTSTCGNPPRNEMCIAFGPGKDMFESTKIIAYKQYYKARQLFIDKTSQELITGPVRFVHEHIDMTQQVVPNYKSFSDLARRRKLKRDIKLNSTYNTCTPALGYSFAAGTTDGPGAFDFHQGHTASSRYWNMVRDFLRKPSEKSIECQMPKQILLATGEMDFPYMWHPKVVPTQILMIGQLAIVGLPGEFTTMSGRRVRNAVHAALTGTDELNLITEEVVVDLGPEDKDESAVTMQPNVGHKNNTIPGDEREELRRAKREVIDNQKPKNIKVVLSGLSNIYTSYITTVEEYEVQRYEGGSTLYGPHTLQAYINQFRKLATHLAKNQAIGPDKLQPPDLTKSLFTIKAGVIFDGSPRGEVFGSVTRDVSTNKTYKCRELVSASFVAGNPRNDLKQEESFLYVDKFVPSVNGHSDRGSWIPVASDASWETKFIWERTSTLLGESQAIIEWDIPSNCESGVYRLRHLGASKNIFQHIGQYVGVSSPFKVVGDKKEVGDTELEATYQEAIKENTVPIVGKGKDSISEKDDGDAVRRTSRVEKADELDTGFSPVQMLTNWFKNWRNNN